MAILSKIRDRSLFLILIIGMALFAFVASPSKIASFFKSDKVNFVGSINGEDITREEFASKVKTYKGQRSSINDTQASKIVWNNLISEKIYSSQLKEAGIVVGEKDIWEFLINDNSIKNNQQFQNEAGLFDEELLKSYIADLQEDDTEDGKSRWANWLAYENSIQQNLERTSYLNLVKSGMGISLEEGKNNYELNNQIVSGKYVFIPFHTVPDSTLTVSDSDIQNYLNAHKNDFQVKASRSIKYVKFDLIASTQDKEVIKSELLGLIEDKEGVGFKNTDDYTSFLADHSDVPYKEEYLPKNKLSNAIADTLFNSKAGFIYGPYEENGYLKLTKVVDIKEIPQVKASHILIAYKGATRANLEIKRTKDQAEIEAKKILAKVSKRGVDFAAEAKVSSDGPSSTKGGDLGWFKEGRMTPKFNDWVFSHKKGDMGLVETEFGFHIIKNMDSKSDKGIKLATISKMILASEETENRVFVEAETFAANVSKGADFEELAKEKAYDIKNAQKLKRRDTSIPGLKGYNSSIIYWTFDENIEIGNSKRFDIDKAYVVALLTEKEEKGLQSIKSATTIVRPKIINEKKAALLTQKLQEGSLEDIADRESLRVQKTGDISFNNPSVAAIGREKAVLGALIGMKEGSIIRGIKGSNGVYALELIKRTPAVEIDSYEPYRLQIEKSLRKDDNTIFNALKEASEIEDYRN
jgi:peptidylprolyl isomerase/peptidyl-prolyl cis-trans isomerase D